MPGYRRNASDNLPIMGRNWNMDVENEENQYSDSYLFDEKKSDEKDNNPFRSKLWPKISYGPNIECTEAL